MDMQSSSSTSTPSLGHFLTLLYSVHATLLLEMRHFLTLLYNVYATPLLEMSWVFRAFSHFTGQCVCSASSGNELGSQAQHKPKQHV
ncbi:uncharacterized protein LOC131057353 isoform X10 [Cryptomeria japonica]|uniref:uncharacterized protein LOC131057353 isoform X10 n=1 Tax=Cryptomeria japonica TaxID=3369 RepID=UPI0027DA257C|nr:uncharacterized protein LOC131057353 isoform X10 [Cryptomeria japonica]